MDNYVRWLETRFLQLKYIIEFDKKQACFGEIF